MRRRATILDAAVALHLCVAQSKKSFRFLNFMDFEMDQQSSRVERRKEKLRTRIIEEATQLYYANGGECGGFENTTIESIADRSDISLRTFFRYFDSKQDVIYLDYKRAVIDLEQHVSERLAKEAPLDAAFHGSLSQIATFVANPVNRARLLRSLQSPNFAERRAVWAITSQQRLRALLEPYMDNHHSPSLAAGATALIVRGAVDEGLEQWVMSPDRDPRELVRQAFAAVHETAMAIPRR